MQLTKRQITKNLLMMAAFCLAAGALLLLTKPAAAASQWLDTALNGGLNQVGNTAFNLSEGQAPKDIRTIAANLTNIFLGLLGFIFVCLIIAAGVIWMTSSGDPEKVNRARSLMVAGTIGLLIVVSAFAISLFVTSRALYSVEQGQFTGPGMPVPPTEDLRNKGNDYNNRLF